MLDVYLINAQKGLKKTFTYAPMLASLNGIFLIFYYVTNLSLTSFQVKYFIILVSIGTGLQIFIQSILLKKETRDLNLIINNNEGIEKIRNEVANDAWVCLWNLPFTIAKQIFLTTNTLLIPFLFIMFFGLKFTFVQCVHVVLGINLFLCAAVIVQLVAFEINARNIFIFLQEKFEINTNTENCVDIKLKNKLLTSLVSVILISLLFMGSFIYNMVSDILQNPGANEEILFYVKLKLISTAGITVFLIVVLIIFISNTLTNPFKQLIEGMKEIKKENYDTRLNIPGVDSDIAKIYNGFNSMLMGLNERKELKKRLEKALIETQNANRLKNDFISIMSHELRTPLSSIIGFSDILLENETINPEGKEELKFINDSAKALSVLLNDILELSLIESGIIKIKLEDFYVKPILEEILKIFKPKAEEKNIFFKSVCTIKRKIRSDPARLRQILLNIIGNAVKFTQNGEIVLSCTENPSSFVFEIRDTGSGIKEEFIDNIFDMFSQGENFSIRKHDGAGIGLAICKKLINAMGGEILVKSQYKQGSVFTVKIPKKHGFEDEKKLENNDITGV